MVMGNNEIPETTPLPGIINVLKEGCNLVADKAYLMLAPILLDLFLLFGPKLRISEYFRPVLDMMYRQMTASTSAAAASAARQLELIFELMEQAIASVNLFGFLRTIPIGISVIFSSGADATPLGTASSVQVTSSLLILVLIIAFSILGVFLGTVYYALIAAASQGKGRFSWKLFGTQLLNVILLYMALIIVIVMFSVPFICLTTFVYMAMPFLYQIMLLIATFLICWLTIPLYFTTHGIFVKGLDFIKSAKESIKILSWSSTLTIRYILLSLILSLGLDLIWTIPEQSSWLILFSIFGHAFISTAIIAGSFVLYRELERWQKENRSFLEWRKANLRIRNIFKKDTGTND